MHVFVFLPDEIDAFFFYLIDVEHTTGRQMFCKLLARYCFVFCFVFSKDFFR